MTNTLEETYNRILAVYVQAGGRASGHGINPWLSAALGHPPRTLSFWRANGYPAHIVAALELLESIDPAAWPARWQVQTKRRT